MRALEICLECNNAIELITLDSFLDPSKHCALEIEYVNLIRHWPACLAGENVFSDKLVCNKLEMGSPTKVFATLSITELT